MAGDFIQIITRPAASPAGADLTAEVRRSPNTRWPGNLGGPSLKVKQTFRHRRELFLKPATAAPCATRLAGLCKPSACVTRLYRESLREMSGTDGAVPASLGRSHWGKLMPIRLSFRAPWRPMGALFSSQSAARHCKDGFVRFTAESPVIASVNDDVVVVCKNRAKVVPSACGCRHVRSTFSSLGARTGSRSEVCHTAFARVGAA